MIQCHACEADAQYVMYRAYFGELPEERETVELFACGTHLSVILERDSFVPGSPKKWGVGMIEPHTHEEGGDMTPVEPDPEVPEEPETPETPED